jgi:hypothetical protein
LRYAPAPKTLRLALVAAAAASGLGVLGLSQLGTAASGTTTPAPVSLDLQEPYPHAIAGGAELTISFAAAGLSRGSRILLLALAADGEVLAQETFIPSPADEHAGQMTVIAPDVAGRASAWIALDPLVGSQAMQLIVSPGGPQREGTQLAAILRHVPPGATVYLLGLAGADPAAPGAAVADYVPPTACSPNPSEYGMVICNFTAPKGYDSREMSFQAYAMGDPVNSPPLDNLPEVPVAGALPLALLPVPLLARRARRRRR